MEGEKEIQKGEGFARKKKAHLRKWGPFFFSKKISGESLEKGPGETAKGKFHRWSRGGTRAQLYIPGKRKTRV